MRRHRSTVCYLRTYRTEDRRKHFNAHVFRHSKGDRVVVCTIGTWTMSRTLEEWATAVIAIPSSINAHATDHRADSKASLAMITIHWRTQRAVPGVTY